jgi:hypothetical protein
MALLAIGIALTSTSGCSSPRSDSEANGPAPARGSGGRGAGGEVAGGSSGSGLGGASGNVGGGSGGGSSGSGVGGASGAGGTAPVDAAAPNGTGGNQGVPGQGGRDAGNAGPTEVTCPAGFHRCGADCVDVQSVNGCGPSCQLCPTSPNGKAFCDGTTCGLACTAGFHRCGDVCASDNDPATCGTSCSPCSSVPANGVATCAEGRQCGFRCGSGFFKCGAECKSTDATVCADRSIVKIPWAQGPKTPAGRKLVCNAGPDSLDDADCPVLRWGNYSYWSLADDDNSITTYIAAYDKTGGFIKQITKPGGRYTWKMTFEDSGVTFHGQGSDDVKASWDELRIDQPAVKD